MTKLKLCNVHKLALSNEGEGRKPIHNPTTKENNMTLRLSK